MSKSESHPFVSRKDWPGLKMKNAKTLIASFTHVLKWLSGVSVIGMMLLVCANVVSRAFGHPIEGTYELVEISLLFVVSLSLAYGQTSKSHTAVELLTSRLSARLQNILATITSLVTLLIFLVISWRCILLALRLEEAGESTITLRIPLYPFLYVVAFNCLLVCIVIVLFDLGEQGKKGLHR